MGITFNGDGIAFGGWGKDVALCNVAKAYGFDPSDAEQATAAAILTANFYIYGNELYILAKIKDSGTLKVALGKKTVTFIRALRLKIVFCKSKKTIIIKSALQIKTSVSFARNLLAYIFHLTKRRFTQ